MRVLQAMAGLLMLQCLVTGGAEPIVDEVIPVGRVPASFPVRFCLMTHGEKQYVAYYDQEHRMTVAVRDLDSGTWTRRELPSKVGWDSHNYITMTVDRDGHLHLAGNMHCVPLVYFRTTRPGDIESLEQVPAMVGSEESRCTYPSFMRGPDEQLIFHYRDGASGDGNEVYNIYDEDTRTWRRLLDRPLTHGLGRMNAYASGPTRGPDGFFHLCWVWRDTPDCSTNHDPSYARSRDLVQWETVDGTPLELPITPETPGVVVDPVPAGGGIINGCVHVGFDSRKRAVVTYHKFDEQGKTQAYAARREGGQWISRVLTDWDYRWEFSGGGSIVFEVHLGGISAGADGELKLPYGHRRHGSGVLILDDESLERLRVERPPVRYPASLNRARSEFPGVGVRLVHDIGDADAPGVRHVLRWETLPSNRDRRPEGDLPPPSLLELVVLRDEPAAAEQGLDER